ncbi:hypothetical protein EASAB2608_06201 [Streptomyces sp. EAS-AB2608]|uniref:hypothetical protein n=1 Tax=Streptomyces sp. EAS-AB2608 TaxID=2779671 RepID=UPI001BF0AF7B|nr:hypothetical protein [Streptomyces sp. EAS-AB2608]BCM70867.1 hypothetical protein EASAB2608_06201 [Streptomyces sp. EAS-AB2608]
MSKYGVRPGKLRLGGTGLSGGTQVELDGVDIAPVVAGLTLSIGVDSLPTAVVDLVLHELDAELSNPRVVVPEKTRAVLVRLGWTPPAEEAP